MLPRQILDQIYFENFERGMEQQQQQRQQNRGPEFHGEEFDGPPLEVSPLHYFRWITIIAMVGCPCVLMYAYMF